MALNAYYASFENLDAPEKITDVVEPDIIHPDSANFIFSFPEDALPTITWITCKRDGTGLVYTAELADNASIEDLSIENIDKDDLLRDQNIVKHVKQNNDYKQVVFNEKRKPALLLVEFIPIQQTVSFPAQRDFCI